MTKKYKITRIETITIEIEAKDNAEIRRLHMEGIVDDHCSSALWNDPNLDYPQYIYQVDGNLVDIWKEKDD